MIIPKKVPVTFDKGQTDEITVQEIKLRDYDKALRLVGDEFGLVALAAGRPKTVIMDLTPASYELVMAAVWEANEKGFFAYAKRRESLGADALKNLSPDALQAFARGLSTSTPP